VSVINLESNIQKVEVRGDQIFINNYVVESDAVYALSNDIKVSDRENVCVVDGAQSSLEESITQAYSISDAAEKILFRISNYSRAGNVLELSYPVKVELWHE